MELFREGIEVAVFGILMVYVLLGGLVLAVTGMSRIATWLAPEVPMSTGQATISGAGDAGLTAAVAAAIHAYRRRAGKGGGR